MEEKDFLMNEQCVIPLSAILKQSFRPYEKEKSVLIRASVRVIRVQLF